MTMYDLSRYDADGKEVIIEYGGHAVVEVKDTACRIPIIHSDRSVEDYGALVGVKAETAASTSIEHLDTNQPLEPFADQAREADGRLLRVLLGVGTTATI